MRISNVVLLVFVILILTSAAHADVVKNISTGIVDGTGLQLSNNASDPDYTIATGSAEYVGETPIARSTPLVGLWMNDATSTASRWVVINSGLGTEGYDVATGTFIFQTTVDLTGYNSSSALIPSLQYGADNYLASLDINGTSVFSQPEPAQGDFFAFHQLPANLGLGQFHSGINTISFVIINGGAEMGLRVEGSVVATVPEPASLLAMLPMGLVLMLRHRHRA